MDNKNDWKPELYLLYKNERTQPSIDLVNRINIDYNPENIIDVGCGPGNSTMILAGRWPFSNFIGVDKSASMIEKARKDYPDKKWIAADAAEYETETEFDIVFSNAAIQWMPGHDKLIKKFYSMLSGRGVLAVQIPLFWNMHAGRAIKSVARLNRWKEKTEALENLMTIHNADFYYDQLSALFIKVEIWRTDYYHILDSQESIVEMLRSTGLKPYLETLDEPDGLLFEEKVLDEIKRFYPLQSNGKVLFPFQRLFFIGYK